MCVGALLSTPFEYSVGVYHERAGSPCGETLEPPDLYVRILLQGGVHENQYAYTRADY